MFKRLLAKAAVSAGPKPTWQKGERVRVISGPFTGFAGTVAEDNAGRRTVSVLVSLGERDVLADLDFNQVERV